MFQIFVNVTGFPQTTTLNFEGEEGENFTVREFERQCTILEGIDPNETRLTTLGGKILGKDDILEHGQTIVVLGGLNGGKGGFGSMLRSQGGRMASKVTTNVGSCRDLTGKRIKTIQEIKLMETWQSKEEERQKEKEEREKRKIDLALKHEREETKKHFFSDPNFLEETEQLTEAVADSVSQGIIASKKLNESKKRKKSPEEENKTTKSKLSYWGQEDFSGSDSESNSENENENENSTEESNQKQEKSESLENKPQKIEQKDEQIKVDQKEEKEEEKDVEKEKVEEKKEEKMEEKLEEKKQEEEEEKKNVPLIDLSKYETAKDLEPLGADLLKEELKRLGLKFGGTLKERCERLFLTKNTKLEDLPAKYFSK